MDKKRLMKFLEHLDPIIAESYESALLLWSLERIGYYQFLQQFCEKLLREFIISAGYGFHLDNNDSLGKMLGNDNIRDVLKYKLNITIEFIDVIAIINETSNSIKHSNEKVEYVDSIATEEFITCFNIAKKFIYYTKRIDVGNFDSDTFYKYRIKNKYPESNRHEIQTKKLEEKGDKSQIPQVYKNNDIDVVKNNNYFDESVNLVEDNLKTENLEKPSYNDDVKNNEIDIIDRYINSNFDNFKNNKLSDSYGLIRFKKILKILILNIYENPGKIGRDYTNLLKSNGYDVRVNEINSLLYSSPLVFIPNLDRSSKPRWDLASNIKELLNQDN